MTLKEAALAYARQGYKIFPITPREKKPPLVAHGFQDSTSEIDQIEKWWTRWPDANIGLDCGGSGILAIDVDDRDEFKKLLARIGKLPQAPTSASGSGRGGHLLFKQPEEKLGNNEGGLRGYHINVRGDGGYLLLPPSIHPSGKPYEWKITPQECPCPEIPEPLKVLLKQAPERTHLIRNGKILENEGRNNYLLSFGVHLVDKGMTNNEVRAKMSAENQVRCEPPLDDAEITQVTNNALSYRGRTHRYLKNYGSQLTWRKITQAEVNQLRMPPPEWDVEGIMPRDSAPTMLFGDGGSYKSWIALHLAACSATGEKAFGKFAVHQRSNSIFLNLDAGTLPLIRRVKTLGGDRTNLSIISPGAWNPTEFQKMMEANAGAFVVLDCWSDLFEGTMEGAAQAGEMRRKIKMLREQYETYHCGGILVDHSKRNDTGKPVNPKNLIYGSTQKNATIRSMIHVAIIEPDEKNPIPDNTVRVRLTCVKQSEAETFNPFEVDISFPDNIAKFTYVEHQLLPGGVLGDDERLGQEILL